MAEYRSLGRGGITPASAANFNATEVMLARQPTR